MSEYERQRYPSLKEVAPGYVTRAAEADAREAERFGHLVLGRPRPKPAAAPKRGKKRPPTVKRLLPGVEERVQLREDFGHRQGTPETHAHVAAAIARPGALARLYASHAIDEDQLAAADQIREAHADLTAAVRVRTASLETRVDGGGRLAPEEETLGRVRLQRAYAAWRDGVDGPVALFLAVIVDDVPLTIAAARARVSARRARRLLVDALDWWWTARAAGRRLL